MPGDLKNPEMSIPYHYDPKYEPGSNTFEARPLGIDSIIQSAARSTNGRPLTKEEMAKVKEYLNGKNLLNRNPGDQDVQEVISDYVKSLSAARRIVLHYAKSK
jgi:hypothetical protein